VHPFYGTYFPTRTEHLELFDKWLSGQKEIKNATDMGAGCGVLTFYLLKHGIKNITATDINPNALFSVKKDQERTETLKNVRLIQTSFFEGLGDIQSDLVIFNPPWIPMESHTSIDKAMYYEPNFFDEFFKQAYDKIPGSGRLVILFSTFARTAGISQEHPVEKELQNGNRFSLKEKFQVSIQQKASPRKDWLSQIRMHEEAELWVLKKIK
jgi:16S rRNA G1207 methylase RsmC